VTLIALITAFALSVWAVGLVLSRLTLDHPNDRSSHSVPTPRGGGLGIVPVALLVWLLFADYRPWVLLIGAVILLLLSLLDDRRGLSALTRLIVQAGIVLAFVLTLPLPASPLLPAPLISLAASFALLWFVNLYNFMDGIDGITGVETISLGLGIALVASFADNAQILVIPALALAGSGLGFLVWNWHPAKVFLGDSGSIPLGLLAGGLLLCLALMGFWQAALILPAYYLADASLTLGRRLLAGEKIWKAHRQHFYQRACRGGAGPARVSSTIFMGNMGLILSAFATSQGYPASGMAAAGLITCFLLGLFQFWGKDAPP
jgi:UDP-N-acetylmuramyl pentapeptide phosphotransferase/UDP-N-acetylglucosamine-1-phosphate transferase